MRNLHIKNPQEYALACASKYSACNELSEAQRSSLKYGADSEEESTNGDDECASVLIRRRSSQRRGYGASEHNG